MTVALEGGEWSATRSGRTLSPGKTLYPFYRRLGGPQGRSGWEKILVRTGIRSRTVLEVYPSVYYTLAFHPLCDWRKSKITAVRADVKCGALRYVVRLLRGGNENAVGICRQLVTHARPQMRKRPPVRRELYQTCLTLGIREKYLLSEKFYSLENPNSKYPY